MNALVFIGGDTVDIELRDISDFFAADLVIAVDSGFRHAMRFGCHVDVLIGDLDSLTADEVAFAKQRVPTVVEFDAAKDQTDFELALEYALEQEIQHLVVVGLTGGRFDHAFANLTTLANPRWHSIQRRGLVSGGTVHIVDNVRLELFGAVGELVSIMPIGNMASGVTTEGLLFPLHDAHLSPFAALGLSNQMTATRSTIEVSDGVIAVFHSRELGALDTPTSMPNAH